MLVMRQKRKIAGVVDNPFTGGMACETVTDKSSWRVLCAWKDEVWSIETPALFERCHALNR